MYVFPYVFRLLPERPVLTLRITAGVGGFPGLFFIGMNSERKETSEVESDIESDIEEGGTIL